MKPDVRHVSCSGSRLAQSSSEAGPQLHRAASSHQLLCISTRRWPIFPRRPRSTRLATLFRERPAATTLTARHLKQCSAGRGHSGFRSMHSVRAGLRSSRVFRRSGRDRRDVHMRLLSWQASSDALERQWTRPLHVLRLRFRSGWQCCGVAKSKATAVGRILSGGPPHWRLGYDTRVRDQSMSPPCRLMLRTL